MPRVSVIIPAYNSAGVLEGALRSVAEQTSDDWEVVVGDDASTDATREVAGSFGDRVRVVRNERNLGPAAARNLAVEASQGEMLAFLDSDDRWLPGYLAEQLACYDREASVSDDVGIVACDAVLTGPDGPIEGTYVDGVPFPATLTVAHLLVANPVFVSALVPRPAFEKAGGFSPKCFGTEDRDLWIRILELGYRAVFNPKPLAVYVLDEGSVSSDTASMARNMQTLYRRALDRGRLNSRQRRIARRELRLQHLIEDVVEIEQQRALTGRLPLGRALKAAPRAAAVAAENPQRWRRIAGRLLRGKGGLQERLMPDRGAAP